MQASVRVQTHQDNVAGVKLPVFNQYETGVAEESYSLGLGGGGRKIQVCRNKYGDYLQSLVKLASLQTSFIAMDEALKITNRRVNALENVTIPRIRAVIDYINRELDELEREDFSRLKMVKKKKEMAAVEEAKLKEKQKSSWEMSNEEAPDIFRDYEPAMASNKPPVPKKSAFNFNGGTGAAPMEDPGASILDFDD